MSKFKYENILNDVVTGVEAVVSIPVTHTYQSYTPQQRQPYIRISILPGESNNISQGKDSIIEHQGIIQVSVFTPVNTLINFDIVDNIINTFNKKRFRTNITLDKAWRSVDVVTPEWINTPVLARYRAYEFGVGTQD